MSIEEEFKRNEERYGRDFAKTMLKMRPKKVEIEYKDGEKCTIKDPETAAWRDEDGEIFMITKNKKTQFIHRDEIKKIITTDREPPT